MMLSVCPDALRHNLNQVRSRCPKAGIMAVIKSNAYGHGLLPTAQALQDADALALVDLRDALLLRQAGETRPIVLLSGCVREIDWQRACAAGLSPVLHRPEQFSWLQHSLPTSPGAVWIKVDTGMHRLGLPPEQAKTLIDRLLEEVPLQALNLMSHLACADTDAVATQQQLAALLALRDHYQDRLPVQLSLANSAAILRYPETHLDWVRPGLMVYGVSPLPGQQGSAHDLRPAMCFEAEILARRTLQAGMAIGYGSSYHCPQEQTVLVLDVGYGDGLPRGVQAASVYACGRQLPVLGRVSMDLLSVALPDPDLPLDVGDLVRVWGAGHAVEYWAEAADTIPYELLCAAGRRWTGGET